MKLKQLLEQLNQLAKEKLRCGLVEKLYYITGWREVGNIVLALRQARRQGFVDIYILRQIPMPLSVKIKCPKELRMRVFEMFREISNRK